jgi:MFS family permease
VYALASYPLGIIADKIGLKKMFVSGLMIFALVYFFMGMSSDFYVIAGLFLLYGLYAAATEGISKAWISNISAKKDTATAIGTYAGFQSICTMIASSVAGFTWYQFGANITFLVTGTATVAIILYFLLCVKPSSELPENQ